MLHAQREQHQHIAEQTVVLHILLKCHLAPYRLSLIGSVGHDLSVIYAKGELRYPPPLLTQQMSHLFGL